MRDTCTLLSLGGELRVLLPVPLLLLRLLVVATASLFLLFFLVPSAVVLVLVALIVEAACSSFLPSSFKLPSTRCSVLVVFIGLELLSPQL